MDGNFELLPEGAAVHDIAIEGGNANFGKLNPGTNLMNASKLGTCSLLLKQMFHLQIQGIKDFLEGRSLFQKLFAVMIQLQDTTTDICRLRHEAVNVLFWLP